MGFSNTLSLPHFIQMFYTRIPSLSFHTPYILAHMPVIRGGCPLCVQMSNGLMGGEEMCHGERM